MRVLALDFDGVIADSQYETLFVGYNNYLSFNRNTKLFDGQKITFDNFDKLKEKHEQTVERYKQLRHYVVDAFSFYVIFHVIENNIEIKSQSQYDEIRDKLMEGFYDKCVKNFYEIRYGMQDENFEKWLDLEIPFQKIIDDIKKLEKGYIITIATNNRERTVSKFLNKYKIKPRIIADSTISTNKKNQLEHIKNELKINFNEIHFIDDQAGHFPKLLELGVKCYLATWGYNTKEQQAQARKLGVVMLNEGNFYEELMNKNHNI